nr:amino acid ABC transporter permease [Propionibacterium sp.]
MTPTPAVADEPIVRLRHPWRWLAAILILIVLAQIVVYVATTDAFRLDLVAQYFFDQRVLNGVVTTLQLTVLAMLVGVVGGVVLAVMRMSDNGVLRAVAGGFVWVFRGTPVLVQLYLWFYLGTVLPKVTLGVPFGPTLFTASTSDLISPLTAGILGLGLNEAAYMAEIVRGGINSVDRGQSEAAEALGLTPGQTFRRVVLPQAARVIVPPTGNEVITMLKLSSLVTIIGMTDLLGAVQQISARNLQTFPLFEVAALWYLLITSILTVGQGMLERRFARGHRGVGSTLQLAGA